MVAGELAVYHQPKLDLRTGDICGTEALLRWEHPEYGVLTPDAFGDSLYFRDDQLALLAWLLDESLSHNEQWLEKGRPLPISVNVTPDELLHPDFLALIERKRKDFLLRQLPMFGLELIECAPLNDLDAAIEVVGKCQENGISVALDDFGTGYSTMTLLQRLPASTVKIDRSFVIRMLVQRTDQTMVASMLDLAASLGKSVIAEGVETEAHAMALGNMGCYVLQGYGISHPMRFDRVCDWTEESARSGWWRHPSMMKRIGAFAGAGFGYPRLELCNQ